MSRNGSNSDLFTVGADSNGANAFVGDIYEAFRFQPVDNPTADTMFRALANFVLPYLQVREWNYVRILGVVLNHIIFP